MMPSTAVLAMDGPMSEPRYPTEEATQGPFSFGSSGFCIGYTCRESGTSLRKKLFPELLKSEKARKLAQDDACMIDSSWVQAQLQHYGIQFSPTLGPFKAKALLLTSVAHGLCDVVPPQVLDIKAILKEQYEGTMKDYYEKVKLYDAQELPKRLQKFDGCATPTDEAKCDARLFLSKYFLDEDGNPDRSKTPDLIILPGYFDKGLRLTGHIERVPALHLADGGLGGANNVTVVGWDRARVNNQAYEIDMEHSFGRGVLRLSQDWDRKMMEHHKYVKEKLKRAETIRSKFGSSFEASNFLGNYTMKCETIEHHWPVVSKQMGMRALHSGRLAVFDLGIVFGLMVLDKTQEDVSKLLHEGRWKSVPFDEEDSDDEGEFVDASSDDVDSDDESASELSQKSSYSTDNKQDSPTKLTSGPPSKRLKIESSQPRRVYFQWRGYNTMTGAMQDDPQNRNTGYLDFANDDATVFEGSIHMDALGGKVTFQGYNLPGLGGPLTLDWNSLSHLASERAKGLKYKR